MLLLYDNMHRTQSALFLWNEYKKQAIKIVYILHFCRETKMIKKRAASNVKLRLNAEKLLWFKDNMNSALDCYTEEEMIELIKKYVER